MAAETKKKTAPAKAKAPSPAALKNYLEKAGDLPVDVLLGRLVLFTISDEPVKRSDIIDWFTELGLDLAFVPAENKAMHAFEKATSETKDVYAMTKGREGHMLCRDVTRSGMSLRRQITREVKDGRAKVLSYGKAIDCVFYKPNDPADQSGARLNIQINSPELEKSEIPDVKAAAQNIHARYYRYLEFLDGMKLRATVRTYLKKQLNAIEVKGGVYFVQAKYDDELGRLTELVSRFGGECQMSMIPIVDIERERKFLTQVLHRESAQALADLNKEIDAAMASGSSVTMATHARLVRRYEELVANVDEHMTTLKVTHNVTAAAAEQIQDQLLVLQAKALRG